MEKGVKIFIDFDHTIFNTGEFVKHLSDSPAHINYKDFLYPDAIPFIKYASGFGDTVLFSEGDKKFQMEKIIGTGIEKFFTDGVQIFSSFSKMNVVNESEKKVVLIDDKPEVIEAGVAKGFFVVRVRRGRYKDLETKVVPKYVVGSLQEIIDKNLLKSV